MLKGLVLENIFAKYCAVVVILGLVSMPSFTRAGVIALPRQIDY